MHQIIHPDNILKAVMARVATAKNEILATMDAAEELKKPLPPAYFQILQQKVEEGVRLKRLIFGPPEFLNAILARESFSGEAKRAEKSRYRRMILIDGKILFSRQNGIFYLTADRSAIRKAKKYFSREWGKASWHGFWK